MNSKYNFKRSFYYEVEKAIRDSSISFILGARKCGKTVCMHQLEDSLETAVYLDMKAEFDTDEKRRNAVNGIIRNIANNDSVVYLIDEATYMATPDKDIARIAGAFSEYDNQNTKVVFSGSQSNALEFWGHIACGGNAAFIKTNFLSYPEWLAFKGITEVSEETYVDFLFNIRDFYKDFSNTKEYLQGCLDETNISNRKSVEYIMGNTAEDLDVEMLLDVMYASLAKKDEEKCVSEIIGGHYKNFIAMNSYDCKSAMKFLSNCGLTTLTYVSNELTADPYITEKFLKDSSELHTKQQIFSRFKLTIDYPMFCVDLIQNVLKDREIRKLPKDLLGSIVECHVRSLLPKTGLYEYRSDNGTEIDFVSNQGYGIEISVSNNCKRAENMNQLPDDYKKIFLTKDVKEETDGIQRIPYYQFIYDNSVGKELVHQLIQQKI